LDQIAQLPDAWHWTPQPPQFMPLLESSQPSSAVGTPGWMQFDLVTAQYELHVPFAQDFVITPAAPHARPH
jgi:hypothetical protein